MENLKETTKTSVALLNYINATVNAHSENDMEPLLSLLRPTEDREQMGAIYEQTLGYNPISFFDIKYLEKKFDEIVETAPEDLKDELRDKKEAIIHQVMLHKDNLNDEYLLYLLVSEIASESGWTNPNFKVDINVAIADEMSNGESFEVIDDIDDEEVDDDGEDDEDDFDDEE